MSGFSEYDDFDGVGLAELVRSGEVSAQQLLEEAIERTEKVNGELNAVVHKHYDEARAAIAAGLPQGPFTGVPFLLKDLYMLLAGTVTTNGSAMFRSQVADHDSTLVSRYKRAGLVIFGKTNSPELGLMPVTEPTLHGPARSPWDPGRTPGGSSGGAGAAVAAGVLPMANASDGGGSIRIPAACNGLVGLKPTRGRTPSGPDRAESWAGQSISHVLTRSVRDSAAMLDATAGPEPGNAYEAPHHPGTFLEHVGRDPGRLRIAVARQKWGPGSYQPEALAGIDATVRLLTDLGHEVEEARPEYDPEALTGALLTIISTSTAVACTLRARELGCTVAELEIEDVTRGILEIAAGVTGEAYAEAIRTNQMTGFALARFHQHYDLILTPTISREPVPIGHLAGAPLDEYIERLNGFMGETALFNQTGQPSISLPLYWTGAGLPLGMQFSAAFGNDALLLRLAGQLEQAAPWRDRRPPGSAA